MPKLPKAFGRRKSSTNVLEEPFAEIPLNQQTFKVFERHEAGSRPHRPSMDPEKDDNIFSGLSNRGSGGSNTNTISTTDNSSRLSAVSTASSSDPPAHPDHHPHKNNGTTLPPIPKTSSKFSLKNTGKAFSFGRKQSGGASLPLDTTLGDHPKPATPMKDEPHTRPSTLNEGIESDYASTTTSPKLDNRFSMGGDFSTMFSGVGNKKSAVTLDVENVRGMSESPTEASPISTSNPRQFGLARKPLGTVDNERSVTADNSSYTWGGQKAAENERLMFSTSRQPSPSEMPPPAPPHDDPANEKNGSSQRPAAFANGGLRRSSAVAGRRHSLLALGDGEDEDAKVLRESVNAMRRLNVEDAPRARESWINPSSVAAYNGESATTEPTRTAYREADSRARYPAAEPQEDNLFDSASLAMQWGEKRSSRPQTGVKNKVMTTAQFEKYRQEQEQLKSIGGRPKEESDNEDDAYEDEDDNEEEKRREQARQRRKQEAHMTVYRQQMMKITGETSMPGAARPNLPATQSTPNLSLYPDVADPESEDEDIPLAILQAHGFPNKHRAPGQLGGMASNPNLRASSLAGSGSAYPPPPRSVTGGADGRTSTLPPFARRLPQDPYNYGAGLVNGANRESLALGSGSQYGGAARAQPGGLVGVIAEEERSRAMRRGSPNAAGEYPANGFNGMGMGMGPPGMMSRASTMGPMGPMGVGMGQFPSEPAAMQAQMAQMQAQLQQSMEMQFQFFQMMAGAPPPPLPVQGQQGGAGFGRASTMGNMNMAGPGSRPGSPHNLALGGGGRPLTALDTNVGQSWMRSSFMPGSAGGYAPSIAPSERSNVGMPGRYRPVSHVPVEGASRTSTMSGAVGGWGGGVGGGAAKMPTVRVLAAEMQREAEEDEEGAWEEMRRKKEKKKSLWRLRKRGGDDAADSLGEVAHLTN